jgi:hypothetical protein
MNPELVYPEVAAEEFVVAAEPLEEYQSFVLLAAGVLLGAAQLECGLAAAVVVEVVFVVVVGLGDAQSSQLSSSVVSVVVVVPVVDAAVAGIDEAYGFVAPKLLLVLSVLVLAAPEL